MAYQSHQFLSSTEYNICDMLRCPNCHSEHIVENQLTADIICQSCHSHFPVLSFGSVKLPFLFSDASVALDDWCARLNGFEKKHTEEISQLSIKLKDKSLSKLTRERMKKTLNAKKLYLAEITDHLKSLRNHQNEDFQSLATHIDKNQGVDSYINNIFRDWCWGDAENSEMVTAIESILDEKFHAGNSVTLGAGACRFSYEFHQKYTAQHSTLVDINPVLLGYAKRIFNRDKIKLYEFPIAPLTANDYCVLHEFNQLDNLSDADFTFLLADALNAPLKSKDFDSVVTPWFIDILPIDFKQLIPHINRLLKVGGTWINTGSLAFFHADDQWNYSAEEIIDLLKKFGFANINVSRSQINYLYSPHSAHGRVETVFSFSAVKKFDCVEAAKISYLPDWLQNTTLSIPQLTTLQASSSKYLLQAQVLSAIDGRRTIDDIGGLLAKQYGMSTDEAVTAVRQILKENI